MLDQMRVGIRRDCLDAAVDQSYVISQLSNKKIAITGGTGFLGSWLAEMIIVLNEEFGANVALDIFSRNVENWQKKYTYFSGCKAINCINQDVRSSINFSSDTAFIIHAAGSPSSSIHASDPLGVVKTILGIENVLLAGEKLTSLERFINVSSCFVDWKNNSDGLKESDWSPMSAGGLDSIYYNAKRMAETFCSIYESSFRLPISTVRPFTFTGPYQSIKNPWAINNFLYDALNGNDIKIGGDGTASRSYLYGSDAAFWTLASLIKGKNGGVYNLGGGNPITHNCLASIIQDQLPNIVKVRNNTLCSQEGKVHDLFPDLRNTMAVLGVKETRTIEQAIRFTMDWFSIVQR